MVDFFQPWFLYGYMYVVLSLVASIAACEHFSAKQWGPCRVIAIISVSAFFRAIWGMLKPEVDTDAWGMRLLNRLTVLLQFSAVSLLALKWAEAGDVDLDRESMVRVFYAVNAIIWVLTLVSSFTDQSNTVYEINMGFLAGASLCLVIAVFVFSATILRRLEAGIASAAKADNALRLYRKITLTSVTLIVCFGFRFAAIVYFICVNCDELGHTCVGWLYPTFYYFVPEIVPDIAVILAMAPRKSIFSIERCVIECCSDTESLKRSEFSQSTSNMDDGEKRGSEREPLRPEMKSSASETF